MNLESGLLSLENFKAALSSMQRQPKLEAVRGILSKLEKTKLQCCLYIHFVWNKNQLALIILSRLFRTGALSPGMHEEVRSERAKLIQLHQCDER